MKKYQNSTTILLKDGEFFALIENFRGELAIEIYRQGFKREADRQLVDGGKLSLKARATGSTLLTALLKAARERWHGQQVFCDPADDRRRNVYCRLLEKYGMSYNVDDNGRLSFTF